MYKISELVEGLAQKAVCTAEMRKQAQGGIGEWFQGLSPSVRYGLIGAGIGGGGAGLVSALTGRRRKDFMRDLLLGGLAGGAGGAALGLIPETIGDIARKARAKMVPSRLEQAFGVATDPETLATSALVAPATGFITERIARMTEPVGEARKLLLSEQAKAISGGIEESAKLQKARSLFADIPAKKLIPPVQQGILGGKLPVKTTGAWKLRPTVQSLKTGVKGGIAGVLGSILLQSILGSAPAQPRPTTVPSGL